MLRAERKEKGVTIIMIKKADELVSEEKPSPFHGPGRITCREFLKIPEEMYDKGRFFGRTTIQPGAGIGYHVHKKESETYYVLSGTGNFNDNGTLTTVNAGDVTYTAAGEGHGLEAVGDEPLEIIALILYQ